MVIKYNILFIYFSFIKIEYNIEYIYIYIIVYVIIKMTNTKIDDINKILQNLCDELNENCIHKNL